MRKLLLSSTALATAAVLTAGSALADVSISGSTEWEYFSRSSNTPTLDGTSFTNDSEINFAFSNKTDSGLTIGYNVVLEGDATTAGGAGNIIDESYMTIGGGFGTIVLGSQDGVSANYAIAAQDLIAEENTSTHVSSSISTNTDVALDQVDTNKISYHLPAMGGFTAGISHSTTTAGTADLTSMGFNYTMEAAGNTVTLGGSTATTEATTTDNDSQNLAVKVVSGNLSFILSQSKVEAVDEDVNATGAAVSYNLANGMVLGAYTMKSEDDLDAGEEYSKSGVEVQYTIAAGLTAVINIDDYDYKKATTTGSGDSGTSDKGTMSSLTIKAAF
jgi:hypothetical protein